MEKHDWLLLAIGDTMEPIQIQKTLFKFAKESGVPEKERYTFIPYNWGPCSLEIYDDLGQLRDNGLVEFVPSGRGWNLYHLTEASVKKANKLREEVNHTLIKKLEVARSYVTSRDFETLLSDIYKDYPDFAAESLFKK